MNQKLKWISSYGGPYILATKSSSLAWLALQGNSTNTNVGLNDYERACQIKDYAGVITGIPHEIVVIADLPNEITWIGKSPVDGLLVKWIGADSDDQVLGRT